MHGQPDGTHDFAAAVAASSAVGGHYELNLYVTGMTPRSERAIANLRAFCKKHLEGHHTLRIFDLYQQPSLARSEQLFAAPTLVKRVPLPQRRLVGDMSDQERMRTVLDVSV